MSPLHAMERSYSALRSMLRDGQLASGTRLEANKLAGELGVSMTPVRDSLSRLAGERMVEATIGDGFHVIRFSEASLRDLYEWHSALMSFASRTVDIAPAMLRDDPSRAVEDRIAALVERISELTPNHEVGLALIAASDRLHQFRRAEAQLFPDIHAEFEDLLIHEAGMATAIRRYHLRRMRAAPDLLLCRDRSTR